MNLEQLQLREDKLLLDMKTTVDLAKKEDRGLSDEEKKSYGDWEKALDSVGKEIKKLQSDEEFAEKFASALGEAVDGKSKGNGQGGRLILSRATTVKTFGTRFIESEAFKWLAKTKATRSGQWTSESVELDRWALTEDPGSGGALVPPDRQPGIVPGAILPVVVADLLAPGTTNSNVVPIMVESAFTNAAAPVAEGAQKPESALTFTLQTEPVRKLAHFLTVSDELLEDAAAVASYIDSRLRYGLLRKEDQQLLFGSGVAPELVGILTRSGLAADVVRTDPETNSDAILRAIVTIESSTGLTASGVVMNPSAWFAIVGKKLTTGEYLAGGPFGSPQAPMLWGRQVALTDQITATTALVGAFKTGAQIFRRGGIRVDSTNAHSDYYTRNLVCIRCEERLALSVTRPAAFAEVTSLTTTP